VEAGLFQLLGYSQTVLIAYLTPARSLDAICSLPEKPAPMKYGKPVQVVQFSLYNRLLAFPFSDSDGDYV
jgi:hypothetical protein